MNIYLPVLPSSVILFVFLLVMTICPSSWDDWMIYFNVNWILILMTKSTVGYG